MDKKLSQEEGTVAPAWNQAGVVVRRALRLLGVAMVVFSSFAAVAAPRAQACSPFCLGYPCTVGFRCCVFNIGGLFCAGCVPAFESCPS